jgi:ketosteroid isomerase-like protein
MWGAFRSWLALAFLATAVAADTTPLDGMVAAERGFSALSVERGMKDAFVANLADDAIVFRPGPINGKQLWMQRPAPRGTLIWEPSFAEVAASGDFGFTTGPWEFRPPQGDTSGVSHGHFVSVWRRDGDQPWRVALDIGISHPKPARGLGSALTTGPTHAPPKHQRVGNPGLSMGVGLLTGNFGVGVGTTSGGTERDYQYRRTAHEIHDMMSAERALGWYLKTKGAERAYREVAAGDLRFCREGGEPSLGADAAAATLAARGHDVAFEPHGQAVATSWDLGYSYGLAITRIKGQARPDTCAYTHLWRKDDAGRWRLMLDIQTEFPKR